MASAGQFSKSTYNKRLRGLKILEEVVETGRFEWKFKMSNDNTITNFLPIPLTAIFKLEI